MISLYETLNRIADEACIAIYYGDEHGPELMNDVWGNRIERMWAQLDICVDIWHEPLTEILEVFNAQIVPARWGRGGWELRFEDGEDHADLLCKGDLYYRYEW